MTALVCNVDGCDRTQRHPRRGLCRRCYQAAWKTGQLDQHWPIRPRPSGPEHHCTRGIHHTPDNVCSAICGCRCDGCRQAHTNYERDRRRAQAYGRWQPYVDAAPTAEHLRQVMAPPPGALEGVGRRTVSQATGVPESSIAAIVSGTRPRIRRETAEKLLAFDGRPRGAAKVSAAAARRHIRAMTAGGFPPTELARYVTGTITAKSTVVTGLGKLITADRADAIAELHRRWKAGEIVPRGRWNPHEFGPPSPLPAVVHRPGDCIDCGAPSLGGGLRCLRCFQKGADPRSAPSWDPRCGTPSGYGRHSRIEERPCDQCLEARAERARARRAS